MTILNRESLKKLFINKTKSVTIEEWDCDVRIKQMSIKEQLKIESVNKEKQSESEIVYLTLQMCCVDENDMQLFDNISQIEDLPANGVVQLFAECLKFNGIGEKELDLKAKN